VESSSHNWLVDAILDAMGDVWIGSGDHVRGWYAIIRAKHVPQLQSALADGAQLRSGQSVLDQLATRFGNRADERGPFEDIKEFLDANAVPWESQSW